MLYLKTFGGLSVAVDDAPGGGAAQQRKTLALLAILAAAGRTGLSRDKVVAYLWPEADAEHARGLLKQACYALRRDLQQPDLFLGTTELRLNPVVIASDVQAFESALERRDDAHAAAHYTGPFLDGFYLNDSAEFERWVEAERNRLRQRAGAALERLATGAAAHGDHGGAVEWWRSLFEVDRLNSRVALGLMNALVAAGDRSGALRVAQDHETVLRGELEAAPDPAVKALSQRVRGELGSSLVSEGRPVAEREARPVEAIGGHRRETADASLDGNPRAAARIVLTTRWRMVVGLALLVGGLLAGGWLAFGVRGAETARHSKRVVVLPFTNLGSASDAYFAEGITEEITARLAAVARLSVIGRTTANTYKGTRKTLREIGTELGVDYVVVGAIRWEKSPQGPDRVRVTPQLVNTADGTHLWAQVYDALFRVQSDIAQKVVQALDVILLESQRRAVEAVPTRNFEAYDFYLRGRALERRPWTVNNIRASVYMFERAVERDSTFGLAYAWLAYANGEAYWRHALGVEHLDRMLKAAENALRLDPESPDAHFVMGRYYYDCCEDYARALWHLQRALEGRPDDPDIVLTIGNTYKRQGRWNDALQYLERAVVLDPSWNRPLFNLAQVQVWMRRYDDAERTIRRALSNEPQDMLVYALWIWIALLRDGDTASARRIALEAARASDGFLSLRLRFYLDLLDRDYPGALALAEAEWANRSEPEKISIASADRFDWLVSDHLRKAIARRLLGDSTAAWFHFDSARAEFEEGLRGALPAAHRAHIWFRSGLAISYAGLGRAPAAIEQARIVIASKPLIVDAIDGPLALQNLAVAYTLLGNQAEALDIIEQLLSKPARFSALLLRIDPTWDPLRDHPRFQRLEGVNGGAGHTLRRNAPRGDELVMLLTRGRLP